jgi:hypothetical protein
MILDLQQKLRELGRIRAGETVETKSGSRRPAKLDHFRITSHSRRIVEQVAELYGGQVAAWTPNNGSEADAQWAVTVTADRIPILMPPQSISQNYELWSGGGCQRRCDGETEKISGQRCLCDPDPQKRQCQVTTRLSVILREVQGLGVFRLDSKGYYAAVELPQIAAFLEYAGTYVEAYLALEPRKDVKDGKTRHWLTPVLDVDITPAALLSGGTAAGAIAAGPARDSIPAQRRELPGAAPTAIVLDVDSLAARVEGCETPDELRRLWGEVSGADKLLARPENAEAAAVFTRKAEELKPPPERPTGSPGDDGAPVEHAPPETPADPEIEELWAAIQHAAPQAWTSDGLDSDFESITGVAPDQATADHMRAYIDLSQGPETPA